MSYQPGRDISPCYNRTNISGAPEDWGSMALPHYVRAFRVKLCDLGCETKDMSVSEIDPSGIRHIMKAVRG